MRYVILTRRNLGWCLAVVLAGLLLWYGLSTPRELPTSGIEIHRVEETGQGESDPILSAAPVASPGAQVQAGSDLVAELDLERSRSRSFRAETLARIIEDPATSQSVRDEAQRKLLRDLDTQAKEEELVRLLRAEGYREPLVVLNDRGLTITLYGVTLDGPTATRVGELASRMTGMAPERIVIMERK